jgi:hypothetical protein
VLVGALAGAALVAAIWFLRRPAARPEREFLTVRAAFPLAAGDQLWTLRPSVAISPDGRTVVFAAMRAGVLRLFRRTIVRRRRGARSQEPRGDLGPSSLRMASGSAS